MEHPPHVLPPGPSSPPETPIASAAAATLIVGSAGVAPGFAGPARLGYAGPATPALRRPGRPMLHWGAGVAVAAFIAAAAFRTTAAPTGLRRWYSDPLTRAVAHVTSATLVALAVAALFAWITFRLARRSTGSATAVFCCVLGALAVSQLLTAAHDRGTASASRAAAARAFAMNQLNGMAQNRRSADVWIEPVKTIGRSGFGSVARRRSDLAVHIAALDTALAADRALRDAWDAAGAALDAELAGLGMPVSERRVEVARLRAQFNWKAAREAHESERDLFRAARDVLAYLDRQWGRWRLDPQSGQVEFADESLRAGFERLRQAHAVAEAEQRRHEQRRSHARPVSPRPTTEALAAE